MNDIYKNIEEYSLNSKRKILIVFVDMIDDILSNKKLFIRGRKLKIYLVFITHSYLALSKKILD